MRYLVSIAVGLVVTAIMAGSVGFAAPPKDQSAKAAVNESPKAPLSPAELYQQILPSSPHVAVAGRRGASGWVLDAEKKWIVTNAHVVYVDQVSLVFPTFRENGELIAEASHYFEKDERLKPGARAIKARVLYRDEKRDLALLEADSLPAHVRGLPLASRSAKPGEFVMNLGHPYSSDSLWLTTHGIARQVYKIDQPTLKCRVIELSNQLWYGDSGSPLINDRGEIVGVVNSLVLEKVRRAQRPLDRVLDRVLHEEKVPVNFRGIDVQEVRGLLDDCTFLTEPKTPRDYVARARLSIGRDNRLALAELDQAVKLDARHADAWAERAFVLMYLNQPKQALKSCDKALEIEPANDLALLQRYHAAERLDDAAEIVKSCDGLLKGKSTSAGRLLRPAESYLILRRAQSQERLGRLDAALADYTAAIKLDSRNSGFYEVRGDLLAKMKNFQEALADYETALATLPNDSYQMHDRARLQRKIDDVRAGSKAG